MKTNQNHQRIAEAFNKLFRTYPQFGQGNTPEEQARDRVEKAKVYFDAVALYPEQDVEAAVDAILSGSAPGVNPNYAPPAPVVASECRRQMNLRLRAAELAKPPALPPPDVPQATDEERARVKAKVAAFVASVAETHRTEDAEAVHRQNERWQRTNARFMPDMDPDALAERLGIDKPRWSSGDPDGEEYAA